MEFQKDLDARGLARAERARGDSVPRRRAGRDAAARRRKGRDVSRRRVCLVRKAVDGVVQGAVEGEDVVATRVFAVIIEAL